MENAQPSMLQRLTRSHVLLIGAGITVLVIVISSGLFLYFRQSSQKPELEPIPEDAVYFADEIIVKFREGYLPQPTGENAQWDALHQKLSDLGVEEYEPVFESEASDLKYHYRLKLKKGADIEQIQKALYELDEIDSSEPEYIFGTQATANDPYYSGMWGLKKIQAENAWNITNGSNAVTVAVIDTGIDYRHPDFSGRSFAQGKDFVTCNKVVISGNTASCAEPKSPDNDPMDDHYHGTHVAGTIGASTNNGVGVAGVNWNVRLMAVKSLNKDGQGAGASVAEGIVYAVDNGADVINMSLGGPATCSPSSSYQTAINYARSKGVVVIVAAGNDNKNASGFTPANCQGVIVVGATGPNDERSLYSNFDSTVTLAAPGGNRGGQNCSTATCITSTVPGGQYNAIQGTSMATPHVAGVAALILAQNPAYNPDDVKKCLVDSADPISTDKPIGNRRLNAYYALNGCSRSGNPLPTQSQITPTTNVTPGTTPDTTEKSYYIRGTVYDDKDKNVTRNGDEGVLAGVRVSLKGPISRPDIITGTDGRFEFSDLTAGSYRVESSVDGRPMMEYRFTLNRTLPNIALPVPILPQIAGGDSNNPGDPGAISGSPSPTPRPLFSCKEKTADRQVNNKVVQLKYLECTPK